MVEKILQKLLDLAYPDRDMTAAKIGRRFFIVAHDVLGMPSLKLEGTYSYKEVVRINAITTYSARYGYCSDFGPVAIIGIPNPNKPVRFFGDVYEYGKIFPQNDEYEFKPLSTEDAEHIGNYTVFVLESNQNILESGLRFEKISSTLDERLKITEYKGNKIIQMACQLEGIHYFADVQNLVEHEDFRMMGNYAHYATLDDGRHIAIVGGYNHPDKVAGFKDVWEYGHEEPKTQALTYMTYEEAEKFDDFSIYLYSYELPSNPHDDVIKVARFDRSFHRKFDFLDNPEHKDFRLIPQTYLHC